MTDHIERYGPWAIVTGASQGIGEAFARELAERGYHLALVSRRPERLAELAQELRDAYDVETRVIPADLASPGAASVIAEGVGDLDVGLLISNAGAAHMGGFLQNTRAALCSDLQLNAASHMELAHVFGSRLRARKRSGGILLVSSTACLQPVALGANYSGAKAFLYNLGESLHREFEDLAIDVTVLLPGPTDTRGLRDQSDVALGDLPMPAMSARAVVREGLRALARRKPSHVAGAMNRWSGRLMPRRLMGWMFARILRPLTASHLLPSAPIAASPTEGAPEIGQTAA